MSKSRNIADHPWVVPGTLAVIALLFRILFYTQFRLTPFFDNLYSDSRLYADIAASIVGGDTHLNAVFMSALYPVFLAFLADRLGDVVVWARLLQIVIGTGSVLLAYAAGTRVFNRTSGYIAGLLAAIYPAFIFYDNQILLESLLTFSVIAHFYALLRSMDKETVLWPALAGLAMGVSIALRGSLVLFLPVFAVYLWRMKAIPGSKWKYGSLYMIFILVLLTPLSIRNSSIAGEFVPLTASSGLNLYAGNNETGDGRYSLPENIDGYRDPMGLDIAEQHVGHTVTPMEANSFWLDKATDWIAANPGTFLALYAKKILLFFHNDELHQTGLSLTFVRKQYDTVLDLPLPPFVVLFALAIAGLILSWKWSPGKFLVVLYGGTYVAATALFFVNDRLRTPLVILMVLFAGFAVSEAVKAVQRRSYAKTGGAFAACVIIVVAMGMLQPTMLQPFNNEYNRLGDVAFVQGNFSQAEKLFAESVKEQPTAVNLTNLGNALAAQQKFEEAEHIYEDAIRMDGEYAPAFFNKGNMAHQRGNPEVAFRYWGKTIQLDPAYAPAYRNIGLLFMQAGRFEQARSALERYIELEPDPSKQNEIRRDIATIDDMLRRTPQANNQ